MPIQLINNIKNLFLGCGFYEAVNSSLIGEPLLKEFSLTYDKEKAVKGNATCNYFFGTKRDLLPKK